jgi:hypothetical protein
MSDPDAPQENDTFDLVAEILSAFDFLIKEYGFRVAQMEADWPSWVRYESRKTFVWVGDERMHYDLTVAVGLRATLWRPEDYGYSIQEVLEAADAPVPRELQNFQTSSDVIARKFLYRMAGYLKEYGRLALLGDRALFKKMEKQDTRLFLESRIGSIRNGAQEAWEKKDYRKAYELYGLITRRLSPAEQKKRLYCIRKLKDTGQR